VVYAGPGGSYGAVLYGSVRGDLAWLGLAVSFSFFGLLGSAKKGG
jgi:hypothetical protein